MRQKVIRIILLSLLILILLNLSASLLYFQKTRSMISNQTLHSPVHLGAVFFHDHAGQHGISSTTQLRLDQAVELYQIQFIETILCLGGCEQGQGLSGSRKMKANLIRQGIPADHVVTDTCSFDTTRNVSNLIRFMNKQDIKSCVLISSPLHIYRIKILAEQIGSPGIQFTCRTYWDHYLQHNSLWKIWLDIQHEFAAWLAMWIIPNQLHQKILRMWRVGSNDIERDRKSDQEKNGV